MAESMEWVGLTSQPVRRRWITCLQEQESEELQQSVLAMAEMKSAWQILRKQCEKKLKMEICVSVRAIRVLHWMWQKWTYCFLRLSQTGLDMACLLGLAEGNLDAMCSEEIEKRVLDSCWRVEFHDSIGSRVAPSVDGCPEPVHLAIICLFREIVTMGIKRFPAE